MGRKRAGAGRKKGSGVKFHSFKAPQEVVDVLESVEGTKADFIIRSILAYAEKQNRQKGKASGSKSRDLFWSYTLLSFKGVRTPL